MASYSTPKAAKKCGVHHITLQRWVSAGKIKAPRKVRVGGVVVRLWTDSDLERVRKYKQENYRKGRGRKAKSRRGGK
jgi:DNA-binding transcriptional MerR regulator